MLEPNKFNIFHNEKTFISITFIWLLATYHSIFSHFFPLPNGHMGHDYSLFLPMYIDNYFWFINNGLFSPPWFSPAFCGGQVNFADPQSVYYSLPQVLIFAGMDIIKAVYASVLIFASIGFTGMYLLTKQHFKFTTLVALVCSAIFMFNGFFIYRMIVGHITFQGFMLIPLISYLLITPAKLTRRSSIWVSTIIASTLFAYWYLSGMAILIIPCLVSIVAILLIAMMVNRHIDTVDTFKNFIFAGLIALLLSASKLIGSIALIKNFPRTQYSLPGFDSVLTVSKVIFNSLFYSSHYSAEIAVPLWKNNTLARPPHELAFGVTMLPVIIITISLGVYLLNKSKKIPSIQNVNRYYFGALLLIISIPFMLIYYNPTWTAFLKTIPIISATTSPQRWIMIYIFIIIILTGLISNTTPKLHKIFFIICMLGIPLLLSLEKKEDYETQAYNPTQLRYEFNDFIKNNRLPKIENNISVDTSQWETALLTRGDAGLNSRNPTYGYFLENLSLDNLRIGPVLNQLNSTLLNIRNPACILYPAENSCKLWDNFKVDQIALAEQFTNYKPFIFERSRIQYMADAISSVSALLIALFLVIQFLIAGKNWFSKKQN